MAAKLLTVNQSHWNGGQIAADSRQMQGTAALYAWLKFPKGGCGCVAHAAKMGAHVPRYFGAKRRGRDYLGFIDGIGMAVSKSYRNAAVGTFA